MHFIVECPAYTDQRILLFRAASGYINDFYTISTQVKTIEILKLCAYNYEIGKIVHATYKRRGNLISHWCHVLYNYSHWGVLSVCRVVLLESNKNWLLFLFLFKKNIYIYIYLYTPLHPPSLYWGEILSVRCKAGVKKELVFVFKKNKKWANPLRKSVCTHLSIFLICTWHYSLLTLVHPSLILIFRLICWCIVICSSLLYVFNNYFNTSSLLLICQCIIHPLMLVHPLLYQKNKKTLLLFYKLCYM